MGGAMDGAVARSGRVPAALLIGVVAAADLLLFDAEPGVGLALFGAVLVMAVRAACGARGGRAWLPVLGVGVLPVMEQVGPLSVLSWGLGVVGASVAAALGDRLRLAGLPRAMARFAARAPAEDAAAVSRALAWATEARGPRPLGAALRGWLLPVAAAAVLAALLLAANPVLELWAARLGELPFDPGPVLERVPFWGLVAALAWPYLALGREDGWLSAPGRVGPGPARPAWVNARSVRSTLVTVNAVMAVQTGLDAGFLWGGVALPEGVTFAEYAHRGAYPLVLTALLAGALALVARPFPGVRGLLALWLGQNLLLVASSLLRLDLYVEAYGLTELRLAAALWMGLVAGGLALTGWQVWAGRSNGWLVGRVATMAGVVLWACAWVNGAGLVAGYNLERLGRTGRVDAWHLCSLGEGALPAIRAWEAREGARLCATYGEPEVRVPEDWRGWGFRNWRIRRSLGALEEGA